MQNLANSTTTTVFCKTSFLITGAVGSPQS